MTTARLRDQHGFSLVELLVVVLIIGILAAIALPVLLGQQKKSQDASAKSDVRNAISQVESCLADQNHDSCETPDGLPDGATVTADATGYAIVVTSKSGITFTMTKSSGTVTRTCSNGGSGGCRAGGSW